MRTVDPPRQVWVRSDNVWHPGMLEAWRRADYGWMAYVRYNVGMGCVTLNGSRQSQSGRTKHLVNGQPGRPKHPRGRRQ